MALFGKKTNDNEIIVLSPVDGTIKDLKKVKDPVFSTGMVGGGVAVTPSGSTVISPINGMIKVAFPTGHAYGIGSKQGPEVLLHIGVDTVELKGEGFDMKTAQGKTVKEGQILCELDLKILEKKAKSTDTMVLITNESLGEYKITDVKSGKVKAGDQLFKLVK